jgi:uncharacterized protein YyaL (SSP411 family)
MNPLIIIDAIRMTESATSLAWLAWTDACARARAEDRPIVLVLETRWARPPEAFQSVLNDEAVLSALSGAAFLAAKADADRRPDLADRYGFGEWPSIACLTPSCALIGGAAATSPELADLLRRVADAWRSRRSDVERAATRAQEPSEPVEPTEPLEPMEPMEPLEPLEPLDRTEPSCPDEIRVLLMENPDAARTALDRIAAAPQATLLASNADILDLFTHAGVLLSEERYLDHAAGIARFVRTALVDPSGGFAAGILADPAGVDATLYVDANARMVSAMVRAGAVLDAPDLTETAIAALERVVLATYRPGNGVGHVCDDPDFRGLLVDHVWLAEALMDAYDATAREPYGMLAAELLHYCVRVLWDANGGGFFDRAEPAQPLKPFALNCRAARTLRRAAEVCGEPMFGERASTTLQALTPAARLHQSDAAALALALLDAEAK